MSQGRDPISEGFRGLRVYGLAFEAARTLFALTKAWPREEQYALTDQVRRSSRAVCAAIAEAWFKRRYPRHFVSKLSDASSEAAETLVWLDFAEDAGYLPNEDAETLRSDYRQLIGGLVKMAAHPEKWCIPPSPGVSESEAPYHAEAPLLDSPTPRFFESSP